MVNRRKSYLINPSFQLKFSMLVTFLVFLSSLIYPWAIFDLINQNIEIFSKISPSLTSNLMEKRRTLWIILTMWEVGFLGLIFVITIFFSHKVAGPLYRIKIFLDDLRAGKGRKEIVLREGDYFKDIAKDVEETFDFLSAESNKDYAPLSDVIRQLNILKSQFPEDKKEQFEKALEKLVEIQDRLKRR